MSRSNRAVVFFCHGSRKPEWREPFERVLEEFRARCPDTQAALCFLELMHPALPETLDQLARSGVDAIRVVPLFLAPGTHTRNDLPAMLDDARQRWPGVDFSTTESLTEDVAIRRAIVERAAGPDGAVSS